MDRYSPIGNSKSKNKNTVLFCEAKPPGHLTSVVHRYVKIWTDKLLDRDYRFHALPDACTYLIFDQLRPEVVGTTTLRGSSMEFNLGKRFHYLNIRFFQELGKPIMVNLLLVKLISPIVAIYPYSQLTKNCMGAHSNNNKTFLPSVWRI